MVLNFYLERWENKSKKQSHRNFRFLIFEAINEAKEQETKFLLSLRKFMFQILWP